jgi:hypothetical protein
VTLLQAPGSLLGIFVPPQFQRFASRDQPRPLRQLYIHVGVAPEDVTQGKGRIARRQSSSRHLIEQRLELLIVVLVDQRDPNIRIRRQLTRTVQSGETAADYNNVFQIRLLSDGFKSECRLLTSEVKVYYQFGRLKCCSGSK